MIQTKKSINSEEYTIQVAGVIAQERYQFTVSAFVKGHRTNLYTGWVSEEFIEDEIDNSKRIDYLEKVTLGVAENHLKDFLKLQPHRPIKGIKYWFREAKTELDREQKNEKTNRKTT